MTKGWIIALMLAVDVPAITLALLFTGWPTGLCCICITVISIVAVRSIR